MIPRKCKCGEKPTIVSLPNGKYKAYCDNPTCSYKPETLEYFNETHATLAWNHEVSALEDKDNEQLRMW